MNIEEFNSLEIGDLAKYKPKEYNKHDHEFNRLIGIVGVVTGMDNDKDLRDENKRVHITYINNHGIKGLKAFYKNMVTHNK